MKVNYDKLWKLLIDKKMKKTDLIGQANISSMMMTMPHGHLKVLLFKV